MTLWQGKLTVATLLCSKANSRRFGGLVRKAVQDDDAKASQGLQQLAPGCNVNLSHFQDLLREIDNTLRALPATGQVMLSAYNHCMLSSMTDIQPMLEGRLVGFKAAFVPSQPLMVMFCLCAKEQT